MVLRQHRRTSYLSILNAHKIWVQIVIFCILPFNTVGQDFTYRLLVINSWNQDTPWHNQVEKGIHDQLLTFKDNYQLYVEYLDVERFPNTNHTIFRRYLEEKYQDREIDAVVADNFPAAKFLFDAPNIASNADRIYITGNSKADRELENKIQQGAAIIPLVADYQKSVQTVVDLVRPKKIYVIGERISQGGRDALGEFEQGIDKETLGIELEYLIDLSINQWQEKVSDLPPNSAIFFNLVFQDSEGNNFSPYQVAKRLSANTNAPIFAAWESLLGSGVVGGYMMSAGRTGQLVANTAQEFRNGGLELFSDRSVQGHYFDWRQLQQWGIGEHRLPESAVIRYRQPSLLAQYQLEIVSGTVLLVVLLLLVFALFIVNRKRKMALNSLKQERETLELRVEERTKELQQAKQKAEKDASTDDLSGLNNRRAFFNSGYLIHEQARRYEQTYAVIMLDVDLFKQINDRYGHLVGDNVIVHLANLIQSNIRVVDISGRIGGEEFAIIQQESSNEIAEQFSERLRQLIADMEVKMNNESSKVTCSFGISSYKPGVETFNEVLLQADIALYEAKERGRNQVVVFEEAMRSRLSSNNYYTHTN